MRRIIESQSLLSRPIRTMETRRARRRWLTAVTLISLVTAGQLADAAPINYGDFSGNTVDYLNVQEDTNSGDTLPLFGQPSVSGDSLDFDPVGFDANATGPGGVDVTDGNLKFVIMSHTGFAIHDVKLSEAGDTTLAGFGTDGTFTSVTGIGVMNVMEVDGAGFVGGPLVVPINLTFSPSGGTYGLLTDGGGGPLFNTGWSGSWMVDVEQALISNNIPFTSGATKVSINLDNTLVAISENGTFALIAKKDFGGLSVTVNNIPEPATWVMLAICSLVVGAGRQSQRLLK